MQGIETKKLANDQDLEQQEKNPNDDSGGGGGWGVSNSPIAGEIENGSSAEATPLRKELQDSLSKLISDIETGDQEDDDCVFSMEM